MSNRWEPISKYSAKVNRHRDDQDERPLTEKCAGACEVAAAKGDITPNDKPQRVKDPKAVAKVRAWGRCEYCERRANSKGGIRLAVHHIQTKAAGGGDIDTNLILLCGVCHQNAHQIGTPSREWMVEAAQDRIRRQVVAASAFVAEKLVKEQTQ